MTGIVAGPRTPASFTGPGCSGGLGMVLRRPGEAIMDFDAEELDVRKLAQQDLWAFQSLIRLFNEVFEEDESAISSETHLRKLLSNPGFVTLAAFYKNEIVGGLTAYELPMYHSEHSEILLYDLAVKAEYQRRGIGKRLLHKVKEYCVENGVIEFFVLAHEEDRHAVEFYRATGGRAENVVNFLYKGTIAAE
jgi:aminoglycoside 3-N-acetyltransferase I